MVSGGSCRRWTAASASILALALPVAAHAQSAGIAISIPATTLDNALIALARQSGANIVSTESALHRVRIARLSGRFTVAEALRRLLSGTGYRAITIDAGNFRIVRVQAARPRHLPSPRPASPPEVVGSTDIVVTASKQNTSLLRFPGSIVVVGGLAPNGIGAEPKALDDIARDTPVLQNTELGKGRNKIFIRGIADSSFNGATQSTASIYFDEVPLGYSGPEPGISLYDMERVEIMEGPQGTLYGSGAIGGIIRLTPNRVDLSGVHAATGAGATATTGGASGFDLNLMANLPLMADTLGIRAVGYRERDGGYIDDGLRGLANVNRTDTVGGRITVRLEPGDGWSVDVGVVGQRITARDSQYAETGGPPMSRRSALAQPYDSNLVFLRSVIRKQWDSGLELISATGWVDQHANDLFDATRLVGMPGPAIAYTNEQANLLVMNETRLSRRLPSGLSWVVGVSLLRDRDAQSRTIGPPNNPFEIIGVTNITASASLFGEVTLPLGPRLSITGGARIAAARTDGEPSFRVASADYVKGHLTRRLDPTIAVSWLIAPRLAAFARLQSGYRTGGLAVARGIGRVADFESDSIEMGEIGLRRQRRGETGLDLSTSVSYARWSDIQADLFNRRGQPYTDNIGDADIYALEATGDWVPLAGLHAAFALLFTYNQVYGPLAQSSVSANRRLPETPSFSSNIGLSYQWAAGRDTQVKLGATLRYVGRSVLGTGDLFDRSQGKYAAVGLTGGLRWRRLDFSLTADNLTNSKSNRFALGNPVLVASRDQTTPLRPRSIRAGVSIAW